MMTQMQPLLEIKNLSVDFVTEKKSVTALRNVSFSVNRGEIVALVGESGSGKSVTSLSILQLLPAPPAKFTKGEILFSEDQRNCINLLQLKDKELQQIRGNKIAMVFQEPMTSLNPVMTCGDQVAETIRLHKNVSRKKAARETISWFEKVQLPDPAKIFYRYPHQLSGGQKQRVMIAMAMACEPALLICDEPTTALDVTVQKTILTLIKDLQKQVNMGVIFITHDLGVVAEIADRAVVMYKGEILEHNTVDKIFRQPAHAYTKALLACRPVLHKKGDRLPVVSDFLDHATPPPNNTGSAIAKNKNQQPSTVLLQAKNLSVLFPSRNNIFGKPVSFTAAVDDVNFVVYKDEILGLVGESGCGKTTLGRTLLRLVEPTHGTIYYNGQNLTAQNEKALKPLRKDLQLVFQDPYSSLNPRLTIGEAITEPMRVHGLLSRKERKEKAIALLEKVNLTADFFNRYPHEFSGGQRQRIVIARALALNPSFLVCDESVSALDVSVQAQVLNLLNDLKNEFGFTVIFISHDLAVVRYISDRIMVMQKGKIIESGNPDTIYFNPAHDYTKNLIASIPKGISA